MCYTRRHNQTESKKKIAFGAACTCRSQRLSTASHHGQPPSHPQRRTRARQDGCALTPNACRCRHCCSSCSDSDVENRTFSRVIITRMIVPCSFTPRLACGKIFPDQTSQKKPFHAFCPFVGTSKKRTCGETKLFDLGSVEASSSRS